MWLGTRHPVTPQRWESRCLEYRLALLLILRLRVSHRGMELGGELLLFLHAQCLDEQPTGFATLAARESSGFEFGLSRGRYEDLNDLAQLAPPFTCTVSLIEPSSKGDSVTE